MENADRHDEASKGPLQNESVFALCAIEDRGAFCSLSPITVYPRATDLFSQGLLPQGVFCVHSGLVKLINLAADGKELIVGLRSSGWILGAASVVIQKPYPVTAVTLTCCAVHYVPSMEFLRFVRLNPEFSGDLVRLLSCEVNDQTNQLVRLGTLKARQRLEQLLLQMVPSTKGQKEMRLKLPLKLEEIAQLIAIKPEHLSRVLKQIEDEGIIRRHKGWIIVSNPERLFKRTTA